MAEVVLFALTGHIPDAEHENDFMWQWTCQRTEHDAVFVGHFYAEEMRFPGLLPYPPEGYRG